MRLSLKIAASAASLIALALYVPPLGPEVSLPRIAPLLSPDVPHTSPTFVRSGNHIYYCVRLERLVGPGFSFRYYQSLRDRGVQFKEQLPSPHRFLRLRSGWDIGFARAAEDDTQGVDYWLSTDRSPWFPVQLRWPWLYVRLGSDVESGPRRARLIPESDACELQGDLPRFPNAKVAACRPPRANDWTIALRWVADASPAEVLDYYSNAFRQLGAPRISDQTMEVTLGPASQDYSGATALVVTIQPFIFSDPPLVIWSSEAASRLDPSDPMQQPEELRSRRLPIVFSLLLRNESPAAARQAYPLIIRTT